MVVVVKGWGTQKAPGEQRVLWKEDCLEAKSTRSPPQPSSILRRLLRSSTVCSHCYRRELASSQLCFLKTRGIIKQSKPCWACRHLHQLQEIVFRIFFCLCCVRTEDKLNDPTYIWFPPLQQTDMHLSSAIPELQRRWWQRRALSPCESGRQVHSISF